MHPMKVERLIALFIISAAGLVHCPIAFCGIYGILEGRVVDKEHHSPLAAANVLILGTKLGAVSDTDGYYQVNNVRAGKYDLVVSLIGFQQVRVKDVVILPDLRTRQDVVLGQAPYELNVIEVRAEKPLIQKDQAATSFSLGEEKLETLPIVNFSEVLSLQPGTTLEGNVRGGRVQDVVYLIDGLPAQDVIGGGLGSNLPRSSITAMTMYTGGFEAEYGNALSGVVNVVTKAGGDRQSIGLRFERDNWLPDRWNEQHNRTTEAELTAGGPIIPEALTYFTAHTLTLSDTRWWQDFRLFFPFPVDRELSGFGKLEYTVTPATKIIAQGMYSIHKWGDYEYSWRYNLGGLPAQENDAYRITTTLSRALSGTTFLSLSLSRFFHRTLIGEGLKSDLILEPYEYDFFLRYIIRGNRDWWAGTRQTIYTLKGDLTSQIGREHLLKVGAELNLYHVASDLVKYEPQKTYFGKPIAGAPMLNYSNSYEYSPTSASLFIQDKIQFERDGSNLSIGLRWDILDPTAERPLVEYIPTSPNQYRQQVSGWAPATRKQQISPRIGLAVPMSPTTFFFVNFGRYIQFPLFDYLYSGIHPTELRGGVRNVIAGNPDLEPERTKAWEVGFKYGIKANLLASLTYFHKFFENEIDSKTLVPFDSKFAGDYGFASYVNQAEANADGVELVITKEHDERLSGTMSYTYMVTQGTSEYADQRANFAQWGFPIAPTTFPLSWDQQHTFKVDLETQFVLGSRGDLIVLYNSARPYTYFPTRDGLTPLNPNQPFVPNNGRMRDNVFVDVKLYRRFSLSSDGRSLLTVYANVHNLLNAQNVKWMDSNGRIGGELGDPGAYYELRRARVGMRVDF